MFSPEEQKALKRVANGGPVANAMRALGKFAPTGVVSSALSGGGGFALGGPVGAVALPTAGFAGRQAATMATARNARLASELMRGMPAPSLTPLQQRLLQSGVVGEAQQAPNLLPNKGR